LEQEFLELEAKWKLLEFCVVEYKAETHRDVYVLAEIDEMFASMDEVLANLNNILGSPYLKALRAQANSL